MNPWINPECRDGKHGNCDRTAWDDDANDVAVDACPCPCHKPEVCS